MALTTIQRDVCRLLADRRIASGESYVAGGAALNELLSTSRLSRDLDLFHDTEEALAATWESDRRVLEAGGYALRVLRERPTFVEAEFSPASILEHAARSAHYSSSELSGLAFEGEAPDGAALAVRWRSQLEEARDVIERLPPEESGRCVLGPADALYKGGPAALHDDLAAGRLSFHPGRIRGAFPTIRG
jgi:hypothetical protein